MVLTIPRYPTTTTTSSIFFLLWNGPFRVERMKPHFPHLFSCGQTISSPRTMPFPPIVDAMRAITNMTKRHNMLALERREMFETIAGWRAWKKEVQAEEETVRLKAVEKEMEDCSDEIKKSTEALHKRMGGGKNAVQSAMRDFNRKPESLPIAKDVPLAIRLLLISLHSDCCKMKKCIASDHCAEVKKLNQHVRECGLENVLRAQLRRAPCGRGSTTTVAPTSSANRAVWFGTSLGMERTPK